MKYQITSDNITVSPSMESLVKEKMQKLETKLTNVYEDLKSFRVVINTAPNDQFLVKIYGVIHGKEYFAEETNYTFEHALIVAVDKIEKELQKAKVITATEDWQDARDAKRFDPSNIPVDEL